MVVDGSFKVTDANDEGTIPKIEISLKSAHTNHNYMPSGNVVFEVTGADYKRSFQVALEEGVSGEAHADITLDSPLPEGPYEITAYYTGSRVYKSLTTEDVIPYLSGSGSGYRLTLDSRYTYGDDMEPSLKILDKDGGITSEDTISPEAVIYRVVKNSWVYEWTWIDTWFGKILWLEKVQKSETVPGFTSGGSVTAAEAGNFTLYASIGGIRVASKDFIVDRREITIGIMDQNGVAGDSVLTHPDGSILKVVGGELAYNDSIAGLGLAVRATNSAGDEVIIDASIDPGFYEIVGTAGNTPGTEYGNYSISYVPGTYILTGPKYSVTGVSKPLNGKTVGTIEMAASEGNDNVNWTTRYSNDTGLVFQAKPYNGYDVKRWSVTVENGDEIGSKGNSLILNHTMLSENITVTVEFQVPQSTLQYKAADGGGTVECISDNAIQSGDVARNGAEFTFKATPLEGYHFVEWQLNEIGKNPVKPVGTPGEDGSSTCGITMGTGNTVLYGVFARDSYEITLQGDLQARYWKEPEIEGGAGQWIIVFSGDDIEGDKEVTVEPRPGFSVIVDAVWTQDGEAVSGGVGADNQSYTFVMLADTVISVETQIEHYDVFLDITGPGSTDNTVSVAINGETAGSGSFMGIAGGSSLVFTPEHAYGYVFEEWIVNGVHIPDNVLNIAALSGNLAVEAVFKDNNAYTISVNHNLHGSLSYSLNGGDPEAIAPGGAIPVFEGDTVVLTAIPEASFMVENWKIDGVVEQTYIKTQTFENITADITAEVVFGAQSYSTVTYAVDEGGGGSISGESDGIYFESGSNSVGNGSVLEFTAVPEAGKMVDKWTLNGDTVMNDFGTALVDGAFIIPGLSGGADVVVSFRDIVTHSVTIADNANTTTAVQYFPVFEDGVRDGAAAVFTVTPGPGHAVDNVCAAAGADSTAVDFDDVAVNEDGTWICTIKSVNEDLTISSESVPLYTITVSGTGGTATGGGSYKEGREVTITAMANGGYRFVNWTESGVAVSEDAEYIFIASADRNLVANFAAMPCPPPSPALPPVLDEDLEGELQSGMEGTYPGITIGSSTNGAINQGQVSDPMVFNSSGGSLIFGINWSGSELKISVYTPDGKLYTEKSDTKPPLIVEVKDAAPGQWTYTVTGIDVPHDDYDYTTMVGQMDIEKHDRICGSDRYQTAVEVSKAGWPEGAETVLLARGDDFPDSLAGISLAYQLDAPVLLTAGNILNEDVKNEIKRLGPSRVIILGGPGAISTEVEDTLKNMVAKVDRLGGANRNETATLIAQELAGGGSFDTAFIATGSDFPDAFCAASYAAVQGCPILLTGTGSIPDATLAALNELGIQKCIVVGGTGVISSDVMNKLPNGTRCSGTDRYDTALELADKYLPAAANQIYIATGLSFPDALAGSVLAAKRNSGILLLPGDQEKLSDNVAHFIKGKGISEAAIFGGPGAVSGGIEADLKALLSK